MSTDPENATPPAPPPPAPSEQQPAPSEQQPAPSEQQPAPTQVVDDANDLRGAHFKRLMKKTLTRVLIGVFMVIALIGVTAFTGWLVGIGAALLVLGLGLLIVWGIADSKAADDFFTVYAQQRGLALGGRGPLPAATPLLRKGDDRYANRTMTGAIADGVEGTLALYTYEEETRDSDGNKQTSYYRYTLGLIDVPECVEHVPELYCQQKFGLRALEGFEDVFRVKKQRVELESEALDEKYEIFATKEQDAVWLRQLFSPTFIVWLTDSAPGKFAFELVDGTLCCYVNGHKESAQELDTVAAASAAVAKRLREEATE